MIPYKKGKRGIIFLDERNGQKIIIKKKNPQAAVDTLSNEAEFLKILNKKNIGPKLISFDGIELRMEFIEGELIGDYIENNDKNNIKKIIIKILDQCHTMDKLGINKFEMTRPHKHIIVRNNEPVMIDFERCRQTEKPKNVTQFLQYLSSKKCSENLKIKSIVIKKDAQIQLSKAYKADISRKNYENIIKWALKT